MANGVSWSEGTPDTKPEPGRLAPSFRSFPSQNCVPETARSFIAFKWNSAPPTDCKSYAATTASNSPRTYCGRLRFSAARFSVKCAVPGIRSKLGERACSYARATCCGLASCRPAIRESPSDWIGLKPPSGKAIPWAAKWSTSASFWRWTRLYWFCTQTTARYSAPGSLALG